MNNIYIKNLKKEVSNKVTAFLLGITLSLFVFSYSQDGSGESSSYSAESAAEANAAAAENSSATEVSEATAAAADTGDRPAGIPGNWVYRVDSGTWGPPTGSGGGGTTSEPIDPSPPYRSPGTPSCPTSGQTCNYNYIYDHSLACGVGQNTTYCTYGCNNNGGSPSNYGAFCMVPQPPSVYIFLRDY